MDLLSHLKSMTHSEQAVFAVDAGTTLAHLRNVAYGQRIPSAALARQIAELSGGKVPLNILRPTDWHLIWGRGFNHLVNEGGIIDEIKVVFCAPAVGSDSIIEPAGETQETDHAA